MSNDKANCVICQEDTCTSSNPFLSPCLCKGSVSSIHRECLEQWIFHSNKKDCSICHAKYRIKLAEETISASKIGLLLLTTFYVLGALTMLSCAFYVAYPSTYQFESTNMIETISLFLKTTHIHLAIHMWYGFVATLSVMMIIVYIVSIISIIMGESSSFDNSHNYNMDGFFQMAESLFRTYPMKSVAVSDWQTHLFCVIVTSGMIYLAYRVVEWYNKPVKRLRIQI